MATGNNDSSLNWEDDIDAFIKSASPDVPIEDKEVILQSVIHDILKSSGGSATESSQHVTKLSLLKRRFFVLISFCVTVYLILKYAYCKGSSLRLCWNNKIQDWIFPVLREVRLLSLLLIDHQSSFTDLHEETCLLENPLYYDADVDCTLCQGVGVVTLPHATQFEPLFYHKGVPVVVQDAIGTPVSWHSLSQLYHQHPDDIDAGSARALHPRSLRMRSVRQLMQTDGAELSRLEQCVQWRLLRVSAVRHLRRLFRRPYFVSRKTEVSLHRYIYVCGQRADRFPLPMTEFANVWVAQHAGTRQIQLTPSSECRAACRTVSALLRPGDTLFYNWRYWRAHSLPASFAVPSQRLPSPAPATGPWWWAETGVCDRLQGIPVALRRFLMGANWGKEQAKPGRVREMDEENSPGITFVGSFY